MGFYEIPLDIPVISFLDGKKTQGLGSYAKECVGSLGICLYHPYVFMDDEISC